MSQELIDMLDKAKEIANVPFVINSGYRCKSHNKSVGGSLTSSHTSGLAVDIRANTSRSRFIILNALVMAGFNRIGIYKTFIHVDIDMSKDERVMWRG